MSGWLTVLAALALTNLLACGSPAELDDRESAQPGGAASGGTAGQPAASEGAGTGAVGGAAALAKPRCQAPAGISGSPHSVAEVVALLNALPKPTSVACFVESLDRPLYAFATSSRLSTQPAFSAKSPRIFLRLGQLTLSVVVEGENSYLLEFGELIQGSGDSIKGELNFPITAPVSAAAPFEAVLRGNGTVCNDCHGNEHRAAAVSFTAAYASQAFRPNPLYQVTLDAQKIAAMACDPAGEPERCAMLSALFGGGDVLPAEFPASMAIFF